MSLGNSNVLFYIVLFYLLGILITAVILYFLLRWIFSVNKQLNQNSTIINLLILMAKKQGATDEEIREILIK